MIDVKITVNGREVSPDRLGNVLEKAVVEGVIKHVQERLGQVRCPQHHQQPRVRASGSSLDQLKLTIAGCCQELKDTASNALEE